MLLRHVSYGRWNARAHIVCCEQWQAMTRLWPNIEQGRSKNIEFNPNLREQRELICLSAKGTIDNRHRRSETGLNVYTHLASHASYDGTAIPIRIPRNNST
jgi:hypothetical protein